MSIRLMVLYRRILLIQGELVEGVIFRLLSKVPPIEFDMLLIIYILEDLIQIGLGYPCRMV